jgi:hypothetical protein
MPEASHLLAARRLASSQKRSDVLAAARAMLERGQPLHIRAIARRAGVSAKFIHSHPELKAGIAELAAAASGRAIEQAAAQGRLSAASLRAELENYRVLAQRQRLEIARLKVRLSELMGAALERELPDLEGAELRAGRPEQERLEELGAQVLELREALACAQEEPQAARQLNRQLVKRHNTDRGGAA